MPVDTDRDGVPDLSDNCPTVSNVDQRDDDGDGVGNVCDNCPAVFNPLQMDADHNGVGDLCDTGFVSRAPVALQHVCMTAHTTGTAMVLIRGTVDLSSTPGDFARAALIDGVSVAFGGAGMDEMETIVFRGIRCTSSGGIRVNCLGDNRETLSFKRLRGKTAIYSFTLRAGKRGVGPTFSRDPVSVILSLGVADVTADISKCNVTKTENAIVCRQK